LQLESKIQQLRDSGSKVAIFNAGAASMEVIGPNTMDPSVGPAALEAGLRQGEAEADRAAGPARRPESRGTGRKRADGGLLPDHRRREFLGAFMPLYDFAEQWKGMKRQKAAAKASSGRVKAV